MSTTWVFLGLLAGRQLAISMHMAIPSMKDSSRIVLSDMQKAGLGLLVSLILAFGLPPLFDLF